MRNALRESLYKLAGLYEEDKTMSPKDILDTLREILATARGWNHDAATAAAVKKGTIVVAMKHPGNSTPRDESGYKEDAPMIAKETENALRKAGVPVRFVSGKWDNDTNKTLITVYLKK